MGRVKINPYMLKWAREDAGYTYSNLPKQLQTNFPKWEKGEVMPTWKQLCLISNQFKRPTAFFFRTKPPETEELNLIEYRKLDNNFKDKSPKLKIEVRKSIYKRKLFLELIEDMHYSKISFSNYLKEFNNKELPSYIHKILNVTLEKQKSWLYNKSNKRDYLHYSFLNHWKDKISKLGILIFEVAGVDIEEMRALCIYYDEYPIILLNGADSVNGRIFSLFHELTHLLLGITAVCDVSYDNHKESFCNQIAAEFLVPTSDIEDIYGKWNNDKINHLMHRYGVSYETILLRLLNLNKISHQTYKNKKEELKKQKKKHPSGGSPVLNQIKYNGRLYSKMFLKAYENNIITELEFSQAINLRIKHVPELKYQLNR